MQWYDSSAENYAVFDNKYPKRNLDLKIKIKNLSNKKKPKFVLDLGCGSGRYLPFLKGKIIVGVDLSKGMLKQAKKFEHVHFVQADIYHLPFRQKIFDLIVSMSVIGEYCPFTVELLEEICNVLRDKGIFLFTVIPLHHVLLPFPSKYLGFFMPLQIIQFIRGKSTILHFCASKLQVIKILRKLGLEILKINERHGELYPHFIIEALMSSYV